MTVEQIKENSIIKLDFSTGFFQKLQSLILNYTEAVTPEELTASYKKIGSGEELGEWEQGLETLLILVNSLEVAAKEQNLVETVTVPDEVPSE